MYKEIEDFMELARQNDMLCPEYDREIKSAKSRIELFKTILKVQPMEVVCQSISHGWGNAVSAFEKLFPDFINGKVEKDGKYSSAIYIKHKGKIEGNATLITIIDSDVEIDVDDYVYIQIFAAGRTKIKAKGKHISVDVYGDGVELDGYYEKISFV